VDIKDQQKFITEVLDKISEVMALLDIARNSATIPLIRRLEIQQEIGENIIDLNQQINMSIEEKWISDLACKNRMDNEILPKMTSLNEKSGEFIQGIAAVTLRELSNIRDQLRTMYDKGEYESCIKRYNVMQSQDMFKQKAGADANKTAVLNEVDEIFRMATVAMEFQSIPLNISGIIYSQGDRSVVIINGQVLREGQSFQNDLLIERIGEKKVSINFKGVLFEVRP